MCYLYYVSSKIHIFTNFQENRLSKNGLQKFYTQIKYGLGTRLSLEEVKSNLMFDFVLAGFYQVSE